MELRSAVARPVHRATSSAPGASTIRLTHSAGSTGSGAATMPRRNASSSGGSRSVSVMPIPVQSRCRRLCSVAAANAMPGLSAPHDQRRPRIDRMPLSDRKPHRIIGRRDVRFLFPQQARQDRKPVAMEMARDGGRESDQRVRQDVGQDQGVRRLGRAIAGSRSPGSGMFPPGRPRRFGSRFLSPSPQKRGRCRSREPVAATASRRRWRGCRNPSPDRGSLRPPAAASRRGQAGSRGCSRAIRCRTRGPHPARCRCTPRERPPSHGSRARRNGRPEPADSGDLPRRSSPPRGAAKPTATRPACR